MMLAVQVGLIILCGMGCSRSEEGAAQQLAAADRLIESLIVAGLGYVSYL